MSNSRKQEHQSDSGDEVPELLINSVPILLDTDNIDQMSHISKDSFDPYYYPSQTLRKLSASSTNEQKFNFDKSSDDIIPSSPPISPKTDLSEENISYQTANSGLSFSEQSIHHEPKNNSKISLKIETSTPPIKLPIENTSPNTSQEFSFFNTSSFQTDSPIALNKNLNVRTSALRSSSHSRGSSVSWQANNPEAWTLERIGMWLELYQFNESWYKTFKKHDIYGQNFLNLTSYQNLQKFKSDLDTSNDSSQSRFIHLLRKTLDRATSITTLNAVSPNVASTKSSLTTSPITIMTDHKSEPFLNSNKLVPTISASGVEDQFQSTPTNKSNTPLNKTRNKEISKRRPVSTFEPLSKGTWNASSPGSPATSYNIFRRQHNKSSSSESSNFTSLFNSSTSNLLSSYDDKRQSVSKDQESGSGGNRGLLRKFIKKQDKSRDSVSPRSKNNSKSSSISDSISYYIDRKYQPSSNQTNSDKFILATKDNINFKAFNVGQCNDSESFKKLLIETLFPTSIQISIHLTDFECSIGEPLDDETLKQIIRSKFSLGTGKFLVSSTDSIISLRSGSINSSSEILSFESKEGKVYPNTPQHYYDLSPATGIDYLNFKEQKAINSPQPNPQPQKTRQTQYSNNIPSAPMFQQLPISFSIPTSTSNNTNKKVEPTRKNQASQNNPPSLPTRSYETQPSQQPSQQPQFKPIKSAPKRKPPPAQIPEKLNTFRVIRPQAKGEINFDKRRESPYTDTPQGEAFIARRTAPPPPTRLPTFSTLGTVNESHSGNEISEGEKRITPGLTRKPPPPPVIKPTNLQRQTSIRRNYSTSQTIDKFKENIISFDDAPELEDEDDSDDSDDGFWAKTPSSINTSNSDSTTISEMVVRPAPEVLYEHIEKFFPNADLDQPVIELSNTPPASPNILKTKKKTADSTDKDINKLTKPQRMKTIRAVVHEAGEARKLESKKKKNTSLLRRQSTKMWGRKVVEMKPNRKQNISNLRKDQNDDITQFSWVKGELIGKGTFGNVYIALNVTTGEMIAVKQVMIPKRSTENARVSDVIDALRSEVDTLKDLDHLNIVQYLGFEKTEKEYNLFLEYVAGGSVASCLKLYGRFEEPVIKFLTCQVLSGLAYLHSKGILHRDMKADNLLLDLDGICKISDFGISKKSNDIYANNAAMSMQGTIFWMAPEVVDSRGDGYSAKVDIWSLGCVVLEMFAGRRPWSNLEAIPAMLKIGKSKAAPPIPDDTLPFVSSEGRDFLDSCFTTDANKRPTAQKLCEHPFSKVSMAFDFSSTRLAGMIRANEKKTIVQK